MDAKEKKRDLKRIFSRIGIILGFLLIILVGVTVLFYPNLSNYINEKNASRAVQGYQDSVTALSEKDYSDYLEAARAYNKKLYEKGTPVQDAFGAAMRDENQEDEYWQLLNIDGRSIMGYISIEPLGIRLPIYHGTSEAVLAVGVGHLHGSSLPVGGENTHAVLSAHTGLPSAELFNKVDQLEMGDTFVVTVLGEQLTYQVDQILTVLPDEIDALNIQPGGDHITLVTCTPYGINSHRLLIRGTRTENAPEPVEENQTGDNAPSEEKEETTFQRITHTVFVSFAAFFEAIATLLVKAAEWGMNLLGVDY